MQRELENTFHVQYISVYLTVLGVIKRNGFHQCCLDLACLSSYYLQFGLTLCTYYTLQSSYIPVCFDGNHHHHQRKKHNRTNHTAIKKCLCAHRYISPHPSRQSSLSHLPRMHWRGRLYRRVWSSRYGVHKPALIDSSTLTSWEHCSIKSCPFVFYSCM
jgi:hypothetical protein